MEKQYKPFEIEINTLGYSVNRVFCVMVRLLNKELRESGLDIQHAEFSIMKVLIELKEASQTQIANILGKERSGIGRTLDSLEKKGYIKRNPLNGSTNQVSLTDKGMEVIPLFDRVIFNVTERALKGIPQKSRLSIVKNLDRIYHNLKEL